MINLSSHLKLKLLREAFPTYKTSPIVHLSLCYHACTVHLAGNPQPLPHSVPLLSGKNASLHLCMHTLISDVTQQLLHPSSEQLITADYLSCIDNTCHIHLYPFHISSSNCHLLCRSSVMALIFPPPHTNS